MSAAMRATTLLSFFLSLSLFAPPAHGFFQILDKINIGGGSKTSGGDVRQRLTELRETGAFRDVKKSDWFNPYVAAVAKWGIVTGYKDKDSKPTGKYGPGDPVTVAEILKMAMKAAKTKEEECPATVKHPKAGSHWAKAYVACGEAWGLRLLKGNPDLNRGATRAEVLTVLFDAFKDDVPQEASDFTDAQGHAYEADIAYAAKLGIVSGDKDEDGNPKATFRPNDKVNRAEAAKMIYLMVAATIAKEKAGEGIEATEETEEDDFDLEEEEEAVVPEPVSLAINTRNYMFSPSVIRVKKGQEVTLTFQNTGRHTFTVKGLGINKSLQGGQDSLTFTALKSGEFELLCSVPGHKERGMKGKVIVE